MEGSEREEAHRWRLNEQVRRVRNFSEALVSCAGVGVPLVERAGSTQLRTWARSRARSKSPEACPSEEIDRLYFFEAHRDGVIVAHNLPLGAVHQASPASCVEIRGFDPIAGRYGETGLSGKISQVSDLAGLARRGMLEAGLAEKL